MQFRDLSIQYTKLRHEIDAGISEVIASCRYISGPQVKTLEAELAEYVGTKFCVTCANGTDALELVLRAWGVGEGDAVFVPTFTFMSTAEVVSCVGATPIFCDIDLSTFNIDPKSFEEKIKDVKKTALKLKAVIPVDLFGQPADFDAIRSIAESNGIKILEDGAQGFGGEIRGKRACSFGDASTTSFFPAKPLGCYGDGGAIFTDDTNFAELLRSLCVHGKGKEKYENIRIGRNSRLDTIQAAILLPKLHALRDYEVFEANRVAMTYKKAFSGTKIVTPMVKEGFLSSWAQYTILLPEGTNRTSLQVKLKEKSVPTMVYYPCPLHLQKAFESSGGRTGDLPVAETACARCLSLPMHPYLSCEDAIKVAEIIKETI